jgi:class 3 adenylate cyclase
MRRSTRDVLLGALVSAASGDLVPPREGAASAVVQALEAERLIELRRGAYWATAAGIKALEDRGRAPGSSGPVVVLFTDFVGSTGLIERLGDVDAHRVLKHHIDLLRAAVTAHSGHEVKSLGDGLMVVFGAAADAVPCAATMQAAVALAGHELGLRIGIHAGDPVREEGDYFGTPVIVARRLCDSAQAGQTLVSELVQQLASECDFESLGAIAVKGLSDPVRASVVTRSRSRNGAPALASAAAA